MAILLLSGSASKKSSNTHLLSGIIKSFPERSFKVATDICGLPLFTPDVDQTPLPQTVQNWRREVNQSNGVIISTPVYIFNMPAVLKNALEWLTTSGDLYEKPVLAITYTPNFPRGEKAMQSLLWSLEALNARIVAQCPLYKNELKILDSGELEPGDSTDMIREALSLF